MRRILADPALCVTSESSDFWFLVAALKDFVETEGGGRLPLEVRKIASSVKDIRARASRLPLHSIFLRPMLDAYPTLYLIIL